MVAQKIVKTLLDSLSRPNQKEVIKGRFALEKSEPETLAAIGEGLGLTRERVRQIEDASLADIGKAIKNNREAASAVGAIARILKGAGGAISAEELLRLSAKHVPGIKYGELQLLAKASRAYHFAPEDDGAGMKDFCYLSSADRERARSFLGDWINFLEKNKDSVLTGRYGEFLQKFIKAKGVLKNAAVNLLNISMLIQKNAHGGVGLSSWPEIKPATARDRAYFVMKRTGKPMHFGEIAKEINEAGLGARVALAATVHNELIKDERFVLVGRGMYGLRERGYEPGFAKDVIGAVLKKHGPLRADEIVERVGKQRFFKPNTIIVNLQNKNYFERTGDGRYRVREA